MISQSELEELTHLRIANKKLRQSSADAWDEVYALQNQILQMENGHDLNLWATIKWKFIKRFKS